jgi:Ca2+-binding EF-hand superfamily protein
MGEPFFGRTPGEDGLVVWFQEADRNHDGSLTSDEMTADAARFFQTLDLNHDGEIDPDEITHYEVDIIPHLRPRSFVAVNSLPGGDQDEVADDESGAGEFGLLQIPEPVSSADSNFNRGVSADEFTKTAAARFRLLDVNHAGRLTLPELTNIRRSAAAAVGRKTRSVQTGPSDDPHSAEYGSSRPPM